MERYLVCCLDDAYYTDPKFDICDSLNDALHVCRKNVCNVYGISALEADAHMTLEKKESSWRYDYHDEDSFVVNEIFRIVHHEGTHYCLWHHGYNGVDFQILAVGPFDECLTVMRREAYKVLTEIPEAIEESNFIINNPEVITDVEIIGQTIIDAGDEWQVFTVI